MASYDATMAVQVIDDLDRLPVKDVPPLRHIYPHRLMGNDNNQPGPYYGQVAWCGHRRTTNDPPRKRGAWPSSRSERWCATCEAMASKRAV